MVATTAVGLFQLFSVWGLVCTVYHNFLSECVITKAHQNPDPVLSMASFSLLEMLGTWKEGCELAEALRENFLNHRTLKNDSTK